jgi:hypothetical protein
MFRQNLLLSSFTQKMDVASYVDSLVPSYQITWHIPEDHNNNTVPHSMLEPQTRHFLVVGWCIYGYNINNGVIFVSLTICRLLGHFLGPFSLWFSLDYYKGPNEL